MPLFYQSEVVSIVTGEIGVSNEYNIPNVQSAEVSFSPSRTNVQRLGAFAPSRHRPSLENATVNFNCDYRPINSETEEYLGLTHETGVLFNLANDTSGYKINGYRVQIREMVGGGDGSAILDLESGVLTNYSFRASVNEVPQASFSVECLDIMADAETAVQAVEYDETQPVLQPQDIEITLPTGLFGIKDSVGIHAQSFSISLSLGRNSVRKIGSLKPISRELEAPVIASFSISALMSEFESTNDSGDSTVEMNNIIRGDYIDGNINIQIKDPTDSQTNITEFQIKKPYLEDYSLSNSVGGHTQIQLDFSIPLDIEPSATQSNMIII